MSVNCWPNSTYPKENYMEKILTKQTYCINLWIAFVTGIRKSQIDNIKARVLRSTTIMVEETANGAVYLNTKTTIIH